MQLLLVCLITSSGDGESAAAADVVGGGFAVVIVTGTVLTLGTLVLAVQLMPGHEDVSESLLMRRRPDGIPDGLHEAVVEVRFNSIF